MRYIWKFVGTGGFVLAVVTVMGTGFVNADDGIASNSQLKGQYAGTGSGGCLVSVAGFDTNDVPKDLTKTFSQMLTSEVVFTFDGNGRGKADYITSVTMNVPGPNAFTPRVGLSSGGGNFTYSVGPKNTVSITLTDPVFGQNPIDRFDLEGHFGPQGITLTQTDGTVEIVTPPAGAPIPRICERSYVLLRDHPRS